MEQRRLPRETSRGTLTGKLKARAMRLKQNIGALYCAARDPRTPWYVKAVVACVVAYALSPIDLIPDFIPILGYVDDTLLLPLGIYIAMRLIPDEIWLDCQSRATATAGTLPGNRLAAVLIVLVWTVTIALASYFLIETFLP